MEVIVTKKRIKHLILKVKDGKIYVSCPFLTSKNTIDKFINDNLEYINKQLYKQEITKKSLSFNINDKITLLDHEYTILESSNAKLTDNYIFVNKNEINKQIKQLFKDKLLFIFNELTNYYYSLMEINKPKPTIKIKDVKSKWGSYNRKVNSITYSSNLLFKNKKVYNYIVVHELSHMIEFNHSKKFYDIIYKYLPNYKELVKELKSYDYNIN